MDTQPSLEQPLDDSGWTEFDLLLQRSTDMIALSSRLLGVVTALDAASANATPMEAFTRLHRCPALEVYLEYLDGMAQALRQALTLTMRYTRDALPDPRVQGGAQ